MAEHSSSTSSSSSSSSPEARSRSSLSLQYSQRGEFVPIIHALGVEFEFPDDPNTCAVIRAFIIDAASSSSS